MKIPCALLPLALFSACATSGGATQDIKVDAIHDQNVDFSNVKTFTWTGGLGVVNDPNMRWKHPDIDLAQEIQFLIDRELRAHGLTPASGTPDVVVVYAIAVDMEAVKQIEDSAKGGAKLAQIPQGGLVVQLVSTKTGAAVWTGAAVAEVLDNPPLEKVKARLDYAVSEIFNKYPN